ncbi:hypothetical protein CNECB9_4000006 [Cupriavidus necator]|uniref:Uncharacterized protein n=1 Tax=Cupriavidus necator TaxID=106590 RepID=A0A1K0IK46_CUPNE|nr:hypothetical protein CNECB9_4000006 [Cupriavidus necator]
MRPGRHGAFGKAWRGLQGSPGYGLRVCGGLGNVPTIFKKQLTETASQILFPQNQLAVSSGDRPEEIDARSAQLVAALAR